MMMMMMMCAGLLTAAAAQAQSPKPSTETTPKPARTAAAAKAPEPTPLPFNIKIEVAITDQTGSSPAAKKVISMITADRQRNSIRSSANVPVHGVMGANPFRNVTINVDAHPVILSKDSNKLSMEFGLQYLPKTTGGPEDLEPGMAQINEQLGLLLESGKTMIVSQAADPTSDRKITVEVTATIIK
jgi:hypothetical protein